MISNTRESELMCLALSNKIREFMQIFHEINAKYFSSTNISNFHVNQLATKTRTLNSVGSHLEWATVLGFTL